MLALTARSWTPRHQRLSRVQCEARKHYFYDEQRGRMRCGCKCLSISNTTKCTRRWVRIAQRVTILIVVLLKYDPTGTPIHARAGRGTNGNFTCIHYRSMFFQDCDSSVAQHCYSQRSPCSTAEYGKGPSPWEQSGIRALHGSELHPFPAGKH